MERKLTAILCADVHGYSRLTGEDEETTIRSLSAHRRTIDRLIEQHRGRFVNSAVDSVLAEFASAVNAVACAVEIQTALKTENAAVSPQRRMEFRIGVNLGDVVVEGAEIYGDGVNVAARLESLAQPGSIYISASIHEQISNKLALSYEELGEQQVKNIAKPVRVFRVLPNGTAPTLRERRRVPRSYWRGGLLSLAGIAITIATFVIVQHISLKSLLTPASIPPAEKPSLPLPTIPSIAVLPFTNMSGDPEQEYFSDGITDDIITALSRLPGLLVIARTSTFSYKGRAVSVQDVSRELGVRYVLEGSVRKADNQVRITAQLVNATTGDHLWAEHYDRPLRDIFALQDEIVRRIVTTANLQLALVDAPRVIVTERTDSPDAYDYYLRALEFFNVTKEGDEKARQLLEKAIELDPKYSDAYRELGYVEYMEMISQLSHDLRGFDRSIEMEQKAIALDSSNAGAYAILSESYISKGQYELGRAAVERALALEPNSALGYSALAVTLTNSGRPAEAVVAAQKAARLDPGGRDYYAAFEGEAYLAMGWYEDAIRALQKSVSRFGNVIVLHLDLIASYVELRRHKEAQAEAAEVMRLNPKFSLAEQKRMLSAQFSAQKPRRERFFTDLAQAGLK
jgi:adenylate cyclase